MKQCCQGLETTMREIYVLFPSLPLFHSSTPFPPSPFVLFSSHFCFPPLFYPSIRSGTSNAGTASGGALWAPPAGSWAEHQPKSILVHFNQYCSRSWRLSCHIVKSNLQNSEVTHWATSLFDLSLADLTEVKSVHFGLSTYLDFGLSTYLYQSSTKLWSKYVLRPYF